MPLVQAAAQVVLDILYGWAIFIGLFIALAVLVDRIRTRHRRRRQAERLARFERQAELERDLIRAEGERREALRVIGGIERGAPR